MAEHRCHALGCTVATPPRYLTCGRHWALVPPDLQREVYRTVDARGPHIDRTWAPWWRAAHCALAAIATAEGRAMDVEAWLEKQLDFADSLEEPGDDAAPKEGA